MSEHLDDALLSRYLAGTCSEAEAELVEAQMFADDETFERVCALDDGLVARYARGESTELERAQMARRLQQPGARERLLLDLALRRWAGESTVSDLPLPGAADRVPPAPMVPARGGWWMGLAAAAVLLLAASVIVGRRQAADLRASLADTRQQVVAVTRQLETARAEAEAQGQRASELAGQLAREQAAGAANAAATGASRPALALATFLLSPGLTRGTQPPARLSLPRDVGAVRLRLDRDTDTGATRYRAELRTAAGAIAWRDDLPPATGGAPLAVTLPPALLPDGDYELVLFGFLNGRFEDLASYHFSVAR